MIANNAAREPHHLNVAAGLTLEPALDWTLPRDVDGVADHVAGAALAFGALGHILYPCVLLSAKHIINRGQKREVRDADRFLTPGSSI